jgi:hypothetical protein
MSNSAKRRSPRVTLRMLHTELAKLRERVEDLEDLRELNAAIDRNKGKKGIPWEDVKKEFGWNF